MFQAMPFGSTSTSFTVKSVSGASELTNRSVGDEAEDGEVFGQGRGGVDEHVLARFDVALVERAVFLI
jgi:hypothetical protein